MRYFIYLVPSWTKSLIAVVLLCLFTASSCRSEKEENETLHPYWTELNESEDHLDKDKCIITKLGRDGLRFHVTDHQEPFNSNDYFSKSDKNIIQTNPAVPNWVLTDGSYGSVTSEKFPKTIEAGMKYRHYNDKEGGIPAIFLEEWLKILAKDGKVVDTSKIIVIIGTGIEGKLGVSKALEKALKDKQEKGEIQDYKILRSGQAVRTHNTYVKEGKKVFTFIHTLG